MLRKVGLNSFSPFPNQSNQLLKFRQAPLVTESLASLEKAVPTSKEEDVPVAGQIDILCICNLVKTVQLPIVASYMK